MVSFSDGAGSVYSARTDVSFSVVIVSNIVSFSPVTSFSQFRHLLTCFILFPWWALRFKYGKKIKIGNTFRDILAEDASKVYSID